VVNRAPCRREAVRETMNRTNTTLVVALASVGLLASLAPATAYHNRGVPTPIPPTASATTDPTANTLTSADWTTAAGVLILCESDGPAPATPASAGAFGTDERNSSPAGQAGQGGLCTTGMNEVTADTVTDPEPASESDATSDGYIALDVCSATLVNRYEAQNPGSYWPGSGTFYDYATSYGYTPCDGDEVGTGGTGTITEHGWNAEIGIFSCFIPIAGSTGTTSSDDYALYYDQLYAWWSYDGPNTVSGAWHGHASAFIDVSASAAGASATGSTIAKQIGTPTLTPTYSAAGFSGYSDDATLFTGGDATAASPAPLTNNCGASPSSPPSGTATYPRGPVFRAPSVDAGF
jgi:hypothetical protein